MSVSYSASAVIGVMISVKDLLGPPVKVKAFNHQYDESVNFCPTTGQKLWKVKQSYIKEYSEGDNLNGVKCFYVQEENEILVGDGIKVDIYGSMSNSMRINFVGDIKDKVRNALKPLGLWHEGSFGLHLAMTAG
jgi:hypothetical protein